MEDTLTSIRTRPRFKLKTSLTPEEYAQNLKKYLLENSEDFIGSINREVSIIMVNNSNRNYWKPNLALRTEIENGETVIRGIFGPSSAVWTFFMFLYFIFSILWMTFFTIFYVEKQIKSNDFPLALVASFICLTLLLGTYLSGQIGQRLSKEEMGKLRKFAEESTFPYELQSNSEV